MPYDKSTSRTEVLEARRTHSELRLGEAIELQAAVLQKLESSFNELEGSLESFLVHDDIAVGVGLKSGDAKESKFTAGVRHHTDQIETLLGRISSLIGRVLRS